MLWETFFLAQREIRRNAMRSSLTALGIIIGVAAVIIMVTLGAGATKKVTNDIGALGTNLIQIRPGQWHGPGGAHIRGNPFDMADALAIEHQIPDINAVAPVSSIVIHVIYGNQNWATSVTGSTNAFLIVRNWTIGQGHEFTENDIKGGKSVCLLGSTVKKELFGGEDPIGAVIRLNKISFKVIGIFKSKGQSSFGTDQDDFVFIPLRTLQRRLIGKTTVSSIFISAKDGASTQTIKKNIELLMRERRHIKAGQEDDFRVMDMQEILNMLTRTTGVLTALLSAVAAVSLLVGGIGIMNIMLVSVTERTREIGTRLAIGALGSDVLMQFLVEAIVLSSLGGLCGIILGLAGAGLGARLLSIPFVFKPGIVVLAFAFSVAVGIIFGYFPARKAARLDPIDALRHE